MQLVLLVPLPTDRVYSLLVLCAQLRQFDLVDQAVVDLAASAVVLVAEWQHFHFVMIIISFALEVLTKHI